MKTFLRLIPLCLLVLFVSCGNIEDKQVTISYGEAKKAVRLGDYYWIRPTDGKMLIAADSKMASSGMFRQFFIERDKGPIHPDGRRCPT
jgi:hypothetical protein